MPTYIPTGSALANKVFGVAVYAATQRRPSFRKNITGPAPKQSAAERKLKGQTSPDYPVVRITDLSKSRGDRVSVDLFNIIRGKPVMGDTKLAGRGMSLTYASMDLVLNQTRAMVEPGGQMSQQRTIHNLRTIAMANMAGYMNRLEDQLTQVHLGGARGYENGSDWVVPLASDPDFNSIVVNSVLPPTRNRRMFAADATSVTDLATTDTLQLTDIDRVRARLDEMTFPLQPVRMANDPESEDNPLYVLMLTARQWHYLKTNTTDPAWRTFIANALARSKDFKHPLFTGETGMWNGIVFKKTARAIRFPSGSAVVEYNASDVAASVTAAVDTDRSILLGAQALADAFGQHTRSEFFYSWNEEETDHGNAIEISTAMMNGKAKVRFTTLGDSGADEPTDHGVMTIDSYAPAVA